MAGLKLPLGALGLAFGGIVVASCADDAATVAAPDGGAPTVADGAPVVDTNTTGAPGPIDASLTDGGALGDAGPAACKSNPDCVVGTCFGGACICPAGAFVQPNGICGPTPPGSCLEQGGTCISRTNTCPAGQNAAAYAVNLGCGDLIAAVCCFACKGGPEDFVCCRDPSHTGVYAPEAPACVYGWRTCSPGLFPARGSTSDAAVCAL